MFSSKRVSQIVISIFCIAIVVLGLSFSVFAAGTVKSVSSFDALTINQKYLIYPEYGNSDNTKEVEAVGAGMKAPYGAFHIYTRSNYPAYNVPPMQYFERNKKVLPPAWADFFVQK